MLGLTLIGQVSKEDWNQFNKTEQKEVIRFLVSDFFKERDCSKADITIKSSGKIILFYAKCVEQKT